MYSFFNVALLAERVGVRTILGDDIFVMMLAFKKA